MTILTDKPEEKIPILIDYEWKTSFTSNFTLLNVRNFKI